MKPHMQAPRPLGLTLVLSIVGIAGLAALNMTLTRQVATMARFPRMSQEIHYAILAAIVLGLLGIFGTFQWRRWGLALFTVAGAAYFGLEYYALEGNPKSLRVLMALILVWFSSIPVWWRFR
jgi:uncharacterized membrane protein (DUF2068 family)